MLSDFVDHAIQLPGEGFVKRPLLGLVFAPDATCPHDIDLKFSASIICGIVCRSVIMLYVRCMQYLWNTSAMIYVIICCTSLHVPYPLFRFIIVSWSSLCDFFSFRQSHFSPRPWTRSWNSMASWSWRLGYFPRETSPPNQLEINCLFA